jgi:hypothetical protein
MSYPCTGDEKAGDGGRAPPPVWTFGELFASPTDRGSRQERPAVNVKTWYTGPLKRERGMVNGGCKTGLVHHGERCEVGSTHGGDPKRAAAGSSYIFEQRRRDLGIMVWDPPFRSRIDRAEQIIMIPRVVVAERPEADSLPGQRPLSRSPPLPWARLNGLSALRSLRLRAFEKPIPGILAERWWRCSQGKAPREVPHPLTIRSPGAPQPNTT